MTKRLSETWEPTCGNPMCQCKKTDYNVWAFGLGALDYMHGYYADPCWVCADRFKVLHPRAMVHPSGPVARRDLHRFVVNRNGHAPCHGHTQPHLEIRNPGKRLHDFFVYFVTCNYMPDPRYKLSHDVSAFLQGESPDWILIEFWTDADDVGLAAWENYANAHYPLEEVVP
jgi:hypothetical protein